MHNVSWSNKMFETETETEILTKPTVLVDDCQDISVLKGESGVRARMQGVLVGVVVEEDLDVTQDLLLRRAGLDRHLASEARGVRDAEFLQVLLRSLFDQEVKVLFGQHDLQEN